MKRTIKYILVLGLCLLSFYLGTILGELRWMALSGYINLYKSLDHLEKIDSNDLNNLKDSLESELSASVIESSTFLNYGLLSPVDTNSIKTAHKQAGEYRKKINFQYNTDDPLTIEHQIADKILNE